MTDTRGEPMPFPVHFDKAKAQSTLDSLVAGKPIRGVRTANDMLAAAGACFFMAMTHGPARASDTPWDQLPLERREAGSAQFLADLAAVIEVYRDLSQAVWD